MPLTEEQRLKLRQKYSQPQLGGSQTQLSPRLMELNRIAGEELNKQQQERSIELPRLTEQPIEAIASSGSRFLGDIYQAVRHPVETVKTLGEVGLGGVQKLIPGEQAQEQQFNQVVDFFKERYGGLDNIKETVQTDPVGFLADVATIFTGTGALVKGAGTATRATELSRAGQAISKVGQAIEPLSITGKIVTRPIKAVGKLASETLGFTTGAGSAAIRSAFKNPSPEFKSALRGTTAGDDILGSAREALQTIKDTRASNYLAKLKQVKNATKEIDISPIKNTINKKLQDFNIVRNVDGTLDFSKSVISDTAEANRVQSMIQSIETWDDFTPAGLDILKRRVDDFYSPSRQARSITTSVGNEIRSVLNKNVDGYSTMTKEYAQSTDLIKDIEKALSLGDRASADTAIRKITSAMNSNNEFRRSMVSELEKVSDVNLLDQISGLRLSEVAPRGLSARGLEILGVLGGFTFNPALFSTLALGSPRLVGEFVRALGLTAKQAQALIDILTKPEFSALREALFQTGRISDNVPSSEQYQEPSR